MLAVAHPAGDAVHDDADGGLVRAGWSAGWSALPRCVLFEPGASGDGRRAAAGKRLPECRTRRADRATPGSRGTVIQAASGLGVAACASAVSFVEWAILAVLRRRGSPGSPTRAAGWARASGVDSLSRQPPRDSVGTSARRAGRSPRTRRVARNFLHPRAVMGAGMGGCSGRMPQARDLRRRTHPGSQLQELLHDAPVGRRARPARRGELPTSARRHGRGDGRMQRADAAGARAPGWRGETAGPEGASRGGAWSRAARPRWATAPSKEGSASPSARAKCAAADLLERRLPTRW